MILFVFEYQEEIILALSAYLLSIESVLGLTPLSWNENWM